MSSDSDSPKVDGDAIGARAPSKEERVKMMELVAGYDRASSLNDFDAITSCFHPDAICELKPIGLRISDLSGIAEMYRRTLPALSASFQGRRKLREWWNQNGLVREWAYPLRLASGEDAFTKQLEVFEFDEALEKIRTYRVRMNSAYSDRFAAAIGDDFRSRPNVDRVPG